MKIESSFLFRIDVKALVYRLAAQIPRMYIIERNALTKITICNIILATQLNF